MRLVSHLLLGWWWRWLVLGLLGLVLGSLGWGWPVLRLGLVLWLGWRRWPLGWRWLVSRLLGWRWLVRRLRLILRLGWRRLPLGWWRRWSISWPLGWWRWPRSGLVLGWFLGWWSLGNHNGSWLDWHGQWHWNGSSIALLGWGLGCTIAFHGGLGSTI